MPQITAELDQALAAHADQTSQWAGVQQQLEALEFAGQVRLPEAWQAAFEAATDVPVIDVPAILPRGLRA